MLNPELFKQICDSSCLFVRSFARTQLDLAANLPVSVFPFHQVFPNLLDSKRESCSGKVVIDHV